MYTRTLVLFRGCSLALKGEKKSILKEYICNVLTGRFVKLVRRYAHVGGWWLGTQLFAVVAKERMGWS